jgi:hypothetical protein
MSLSVSPGVVIAAGAGREDFIPLLSIPVRSGAHRLYK